MVRHDRQYWLTAVVLAAGVAIVSSGCAGDGLKLGQRGDQWEPDPSEGDKWSQVGKEGRGNRPLEDENDPLKPFLMSDQARQIERNLGYK